MPHRWGIPTLPSRNGACTRRRMGARPGSRSCSWTKTPAVPTWPLIPNIPAPSMPPCGRSPFNTWQLNSGGPGSGIFRTKDGGNTWERLSGLPGGAGHPVGKTSVDVSYSNPNIVYALIEDKDPGPIPVGRRGRQLEAHVPESLHGPACVLLYPGTGLHGRPQ
jgi:hypothetical protein